MEDTNSKKNTTESLKMHPYLKIMHFLNAQEQKQQHREDGDENKLEIILFFS